LHAPELLLLDEPTAGLDLSARSEFLAAIARWRTSQRVTIVTSTHFMDEAEHAQRVVLMHAGKIVGDGSPAELRASLGGMVIRVGASEGSDEDAQARELLTRAGLDVHRESSTTLIGKAKSVSAQMLRELMGDLLSRGLSVSAGPATLGDVYLSLTGSALGESSETRREWEAPVRGARR
jgi:ABC-type multidrug transport system ATPase subunit